MNAKKNILIFNDLENSSLQPSLQSCQLSHSTCLQVQEVLFSTCKENEIDNQEIEKTLFVSLFAKPFCRMQKNGGGSVYEQKSQKSK